MSKRSRKTVEEKLEIVQQYLSHKQSLSQLAKSNQVSDYAITQWVKRYQKDGRDILNESRTWIRIPKN